MRMVKTQERRCLYSLHRNESRCGEFVGPRCVQDNVERALPVESGDANQILDSCSLGSAWNTTVMCFLPAVLWLAYNQEYTLAII